jgi:hypothetical protein
LVTSPPTNAPVMVTKGLAQANGRFAPSLCL